MLADTHDGQHDIAKTNQMISRTVRDSAVAFHMTQDPNNGQYPMEALIESPSSERLLRHSPGSRKPGCPWECI
jgi:amidase